MRLRQALRFVISGYCQWRGDIAYRLLGPQSLETRLLPSLTDPVKTYYACASSLLGLTDPAWAVGLGLFGRALEIDRKPLLSEVNLRTGYLNAKNAK